MTIGLAFWVIMLVGLIFGFATWRGAIAGSYGWYGNSLLVFVLFLLLGWKVFGAPLHG